MMFNKITTFEKTELRLKKILIHKELLLYALVMALLLFVVKWIEYHVYILSHRMELYMGFVALLFTLLGIWASKKLTKKETIIIEKEVIVQKNVHFQINQKELSNRKISQRELQVLELMSDGLTNQEIADRLFVSLNTIKTHSSNLYEKLEVKRRTQAIETAKKLNILP
jgi:two-component system, NarL family, response regulator LiaR